MADRPLHGGGGGLGDDDGLRRLGLLIVKGRAHKDVSRFLGLPDRSVA
jgi:hypothetical protein